MWSVLARRCIIWCPHEVFLFGVLLSVRCSMKENWCSLIRIFNMVDSCSVVCAWRITPCGLYETVWSYDWWNVALTDWTCWLILRSVSQEFFLVFFSLQFMRVYAVLQYLGADLSPAFQVCVGAICYSR